MVNKEKSRLSRLLKKKTLVEEEAEEFLEEEVVIDYNLTRLLQNASSVTD